MGGVRSIVTPSEENVDRSPASLLQVTVVTTVVPCERRGSVTCAEVPVEGV